MDGYKSIEVALFKKGKIIYIGEPQTPKIVKFLSRGKVKYQNTIGRGLEHLSLGMFILAIFYWITF
jgi:hypothetical protein